MHCIIQTQTYIINRTSQHEHVQELWQGWLGRLHMSPKTHKKMPVPIMPQKHQQPLVGQKQKDQNHTLVTNLCQSMSQKHNETITFQQPLVGHWSKIHAQHGSNT